MTTKKTSKRMTIINPALTQWKIWVVVWSIRCSNAFGSIGAAGGIVEDNGLRPHMALRRLSRS